MDSGAYREKIIFQKYTEGFDDIGNPQNEWQKCKTAYAYANGLSGREYWEAANVNQENTVDFVFRWKPFFDAMDTKRYRLIFRGTIYNISSIDNIQFRNKTVKIRAVTKNERGSKH